MNLSALNKLPSNGLAPATTEALPNASALARLSSGGMSGADFASFLHNQVQALKSSERQHLAADHGKLPQRGRDEAQANTQDDNKPVRARAAQHTSNRDAKAVQSDGDQTDKDTTASQQAKTDAASDAASDAAAEAATDKQAQSAATTQDGEVQASQTLNDAVNAQAKALSQRKAADKSGAEDDTGLDQTAGQTLNTDSTLANTGSTSASSGALTTIALSDKLQIITATQTAPNEKSLSDFALSMGLDQSQVKALFGQASAVTAPSKTGLSTQDLLTLNTTPSQPQTNSGLFSTGADSLPGMLPLNVATAPVSSADFQALQQVNPNPDKTQDADLLSKMNNMQLQVGAAAVQQSMAPPPPSTLSVLSMMDAQLRSEDIESLKNQFDDFQSSALTGTTDLTPGNAATAPPWRTGSNPEAKPAAQAFVNQTDMAETYENLSQKLSTELAGRMHEKLNAGEWKMKFALKPASLGLVDVQLEMRDGKLTAQFHSDTAFTQDLIQNGSQKLKDALADLGLNNTSVMVNQGQSQGASLSGQGGQQSQTGIPVKREENREKLTNEPGPKIATESGTRRNKRSQFDSYA